MHEDMTEKVQKMGDKIKQRLNEAGDKIRQGSEKAGDATDRKLDRIERESEKPNKPVV